MQFRPGRPRPPLTSLLVLIVLLLALAVPAMVSAGGSFSIGLAQRASGLSALTQVTNAGDGSNRLFLVEQRGTIRVYEDGKLKSGYFMDIRSKVEDGGERGLLGLAFDPDFDTNHRIFVYYTRNGGDVVLSRYTTNSAGTNVDEGTHSPLLLIEHSSATNHNGGALVFGPDGFLYVGIGDGGGTGDPGNDAQQPSKNFLGKILRINPDGSGGGDFDRYSIPASNPLFGGDPDNDEVWAWGLRNPWRIAFDRVTDELFIADVGQSKWEEINREPGGFGGGRNYGWRVMEGKHCYHASSCSLSGDTLPIAEYSHSGGNCSITGGHVYRGSLEPQLAGHYVFADWCSGKIWSMPHDGDGSDKVVRRDSSQHITSFGESEGGEIYAVTSNGRLYRVYVP
jgi:glucose/arabinose dehydrogenase